jgi:hypothetical protein
MIKQEKDWGIRARGIREVLGGKIRDDGRDHLAEAPADPGRIGLSVTTALNICNMHQESTAFAYTIKYNL